MDTVQWLLFITLLFVIVTASNEDEGFTAGSGALTQLYAKGIQDTYTIGNQALEYYPPCWYGRCREMIWNNPTRFPSTYYYPLYGIFPWYWIPMYPPKYWEAPYLRAQLPQ